MFMHFAWGGIANSSNKSLPLTSGGFGVKLLVL